eukprot:Skav231980  [mRNA]  locus=scaffold719:5577:6257:- [translate_table: standard]
MRSCRGTVDVLHGNAILSSFGDSRGAATPWPRVVHLLLHIRGYAVRSDTRSFNIARTQVGTGPVGTAWRVASGLLEKQRQEGLGISVVSTGCTADLLGKAGRWRDAWLCLAGRPNVVPWRETKQH